MERRSEVTLDTEVVDNVFCIPGRGLARGTTVLATPAIFFRVPKWVMFSNSLLLRDLGVGSQQMEVALRIICVQSLASSSYHLLPSYHLPHEQLASPLTGNMSLTGNMLTVIWSPPLSPCTRTFYSPTIRCNCWKQLLKFFDFLRPPSLLSYKLYNENNQMGVDVDSSVSLISFMFLLVESSSYHCVHYVFWSIYKYSSFSFLNSFSGS